LVYLDNAATTKPTQNVLDSVVNYLTNEFGNPSSLHKLGLSSQKLIDKSRSIIAKSLKCESSNIYFTSGATESNNIALFGAAEMYGKRKKRIISTSIEHASVNTVLKKLETMGYEIVKIHPNSNGIIDVNDIIEKIDENTFLISMMAVNNETGYLLPIKETIKIAKKINPNIIFHCDAVQAYMKMPFNVKEFAADIVSISAHKIHALKGTGAIYVKKGIRVSPANLGGGQENGLRAGTEAVQNIVSFGAAVEELENTIKTRYSYVYELKTYFLDKIKNIDYISVNSKGDTSPYIINISVLNIKSEIMLHFLEEKNIYISTGSACSKGKKSEVLKAFGVEDNLIDTALRISFNSENTKNEMDTLLFGINEGYEKLIKLK
jgi:cysteine desulfurase